MPQYPDAAAMLAAEAARLAPPAAEPAAEPAAPPAAQPEPREFRCALRPRQREALHQAAVAVAEVEGLLRERKARYEALAVVVVEAHDLLETDQVRLDLERGELVVTRLVTPRPPAPA